MKVCEICGEEIYTKDGENRCRDCDEKKAARVKRARVRQRRREREDVLRSLGLTKVRGALGGTYWE